jgi:hypothetical protein
LKPLFCFLLGNRKGVSAAGTRGRGVLDPARIPEDFFKSQFSPTGDSHGRLRRHPDDLLALWSESDRAEAYPLDDLVRALRLGDAVRVAR